MDKKLAEYRLRQRKNELINSTVNKLKIWPRTIMEEVVVTSNPTCEQQSTKTKHKAATVSTSQSQRNINSVSDSDDISVISTASSPTTSDTDANPPNCLDYFLYILYFVFWTTLFFVFIKLGFGTVYIIISALIGIYINTGTKPKKDGQMSAYSVFNENCERIDGTLSAEQFEREIGYKL